MAVRGIRGATTADANRPDDIITATKELLQAIIEANQLDPAEVAFAYFTTTPDLNAEFPAVAARQLGWFDVPLLCGHEMNVPASNPRSVPRCIRVLILYNTERPAKDMKFIYLKGAAAIKEDLERMRSGMLP
jgi:chorismate mutase